MKHVVGVARVTHVTVGHQPPVRHPRPVGITRLHAWVGDGRPRGAATARRRAYPGPVGIDDLVDEWLPLPDVAERLGEDVGSVRRRVQEGSLLALRVGERSVQQVPAAFLVTRPDGGVEVIPALAGTLSVLADAGLTPEESVRWLFTPDESLASLGSSRPGTPVEALAAGHKTEIRRRAQAEAL